MAERRFPSADYWRQPIKWNAEAERSGERRRVFCASMADVFESRADLRASRAKLWSLIEGTSHLDWLLLTKRPQNIARMAPWGNHWPDNVWLGTTAETQKHADGRIPVLLESPARVHFISAEPLLGVCPSNGS
jgi:protein gp37